MPIRKFSFTQPKKPVWYFWNNTSRGAWKCRVLKTFYNGRIVWMVYRPKKVGCAKLSVINKKFLCVEVCHKTPKEVTAAYVNRTPVKASFHMLPVKSGCGLDVVKLIESGL
jgi:hypothetical protein